MAASARNLKALSSVAAGFLSSCLPVGVLSMPGLWLMGAWSPRVAVESREEDMVGA